MKCLIIQTAFIGDAILATALVEDLKNEYPNAQVDFLLRKGNEGLLAGNPKLDKLYVWDKKRKTASQIEIIKRIRKEKYDYVFNLQRYLSSGLFTIFSGARHKIGFKKNPLSAFFSERIDHTFEKGIHETDRNNGVIQGLVPNAKKRPKLYPGKSDYEKVAKLKIGEYFVIAPTSVWYTKQWPAGKWAELIKKLPDNAPIYLVGAPGDKNGCEAIKDANKEKAVVNLAGELSLLQTAALMQDAKMNYMNDSAPLHLASSMNAPTRAVFCSTVTDFGYTPLSDNSAVIEHVEELECRPCGLHGHKSCPKDHYKCAVEIEVDERFF